MKSVAATKNEECIRKQVKVVKLGSVYKNKTI